MCIMDTSTTVDNMPEPTTVPTDKKEVKIVDVVVKDEIVAFNLIISFLNLAQKRGAFSFDESAKIWECIQMFQRVSTTVASSSV